ncbi:hypothetical protein ACE193_04295 [Bernardetia sp. OM2101]|uniref:hypothetical protein n=1 Tax=Bernardetia sp. OM2101 TaxID=3344876 RepID=UPI0035CFC012
MKHQFQLPDFPNTLFEIETSIWTGKPNLKKNGIQVERSNEKGKPFLISTDTGKTVKAYHKTSFPDFAPTLEIDGIKHQVTPQLKWFQYILGGLPILLVFVGGAIGGLVGMFATAINFNIFRQDNSSTSKYLKVIGIIIASYTIYFVCAILITMLIQ